MSNITADRVVNTTLYAKQSVPLYRGDLATVVQTIPPGGLVGTVYSYVVRNGKLYWMFYDKYNQPYYAEHTPTTFQLSGDIERALEIYRAELAAIDAQTEIEQKGTIPYYIEKYGKVILGVTVAVIIGKELIKKIKV